MTNIEKYAVQTRAIVDRNWAEAKDIFNAKIEVVMNEAPELSPEQCALIAKSELEAEENWAKVCVRTVFVELCVAELEARVITNPKSPYSV